ncbi:DUF7344 domain-containing protein [Halorubrum trueperi]|uniref:DUF7344 domain-containing protein n=1 Tax=Halorubrum trueperi TaxID=2004704 RepID=A0ABD5UJD9_9EURY
MPDIDTRTLSQDIAFDLLSNARRRFVLRRLQEASEPIELGDLAGDLAAAETGVPVDELTAQQRKRTYVSLYQTHIPKMVEAGVIEYDRDAGTVSATERVDELASYFHTPPRMPLWAVAYGGLSLFGIAVYLLVALLNPDFVDPIQIGLLFFVAFSALSLVHYQYVTRGRGTDGLVPFEEGE